MTKPLRIDSLPAVSGLVLAVVVALALASASVACSSDGGTPNNGGGSGGAAGSRASGGSGGKANGGAGGNAAGGSGGSATGGSGAGVGGSAGAFASGAGGSGVDGGNADAPGTNPSDGAAGVLYGGVVVDFQEDHTAFLGAFFDGPVLPSRTLDVSQTVGPCELLVPRPAMCPAGCGIDGVCTGTNQCTSMPKPVSVGTLQIRGLGGADREAEPTGPTVPSYQVVPTLPFPSCKPGDPVEVRAAAFTLAGHCIEALTLTSAAPISVVSGQPMRLAWTAPAQPDISRVHIELEISHHGGFKGQIECVVPDTGAFDVPEPLITELVKLGRAGYPTVRVTRQSIAKTTAQPNISLTVSSLVEREVDTGVVSCGSSSSPPCPAGKTCQANFTCP